MCTHAHTCTFILVPETTRLSFIEILFQTQKLFFFLVKKTENLSILLDITFIDDTNQV